MKRTMVMMIGIGIGLFGIHGCTGAQTAIDTVMQETMGGFRLAARSIVFLLLQVATVVSGVGVFTFWLSHFVAGLFLQFQTMARIHQTTQQNMLTGFAGSLVAIVLISLAATGRFDVIVDAILPLQP